LLTFFLYNPILIKIGPSLMHLLLFILCINIINDIYYKK